MIQYLLDHRWNFNAGDDPDWPATDLADLNIDIEHSLQPVRPYHQCLAFGGRFFSKFIYRPIPFHFWEYADLNF